MEPLHIKDFRANKLTHATDMNKKIATAPKRNAKQHFSEVKQLVFYLHRKFVSILQYPFFFFSMRELLVWSWTTFLKILKSIVKLISVCCLSIKTFSFSVEKLFQLQKLNSDKKRSRNYTSLVETFSQVQKMEDILDNF